MRACRPVEVQTGADRRRVGPAFCHLTTFPAGIDNGLPSASITRNSAADTGRHIDWGGITIILLSALFLGVTSYISYLRWRDFQYRTFDLAYYVQAIWQLVHGRFQVSVEPVPLLGNHVEPIVLLFAPIFLVVRHPLVFVAGQNVLLASIGLIGYRLARQLFNPTAAAVLAAVLLLSPALGYVALHEFHPEALTAPLLLLMIYASRSGRRWLYWTSLVLVLACKENMALLLVAYCTVFLFIERRRPLSELWKWYGAPLVVAVLWFGIATRVITPTLNSGNIDYLALYDRLGRSAGEIAWNVVTRPQLVLTQIAHALCQGNLLWGLILPLAGLPVLRPRWLLIGTPILLQHLLSWRSSEWTIYFHYGAPLLPLLWIATLEALARLRDGAQPLAPGRARGYRRGISGGAPAGVLGATIAGQLWIGALPSMCSDLAHRSLTTPAVSAKRALLARIPADASVVAPLPYLSHLATRQKLYSLHYILKGLKTLSHEPYELPPPTDFVLIDFNDVATFDADAGFYHPAMRTTEGRLLPSSDQLLHEFLRGAKWIVQQQGDLALFSRTKASEPSANQLEQIDRDKIHTPITVGPGNSLTGAQLSISGRALALQLRWRVASDRRVFPWMILEVTGGDNRPHYFTKGLCAVAVNEGTTTEGWSTSMSGLSPDKYTARALFVDNSRRAWLAAHDGDWSGTNLSGPVPLGTFEVVPSH